LPEQLTGPRVDLEGAKADRRRREWFHGKCWSGYHTGGALFSGVPRCGLAVTPRHQNAFQGIFSEGKKKPAAIELPEGASRVRSRLARFMSSEEAFMNSSTEGTLTNGHTD